MTDQPPVANPMNAAAISMNRQPAAATPMNSVNPGKPSNITGKTILISDTCSTFSCRSSSLTFAVS